MYKLALFWCFTLSTFRVISSCEPNTKQGLILEITDSLETYPENEAFTVFDQKCENYFKIESTDGETEIEVQQKTSPNTYYKSKLKRIKTFCSVAAVKRSVLTTSQETKLVNKYRSLSEEHAFDNHRNRLVLLTGYIKTTIDTHCSEKEKPLLIQTLTNSTLYQLVGSKPWRETPHDFPYENIELYNSKKFSYFTYNLWTDILVLVVIGTAFIISIPETTHLFIGSNPACIPCRLFSKITQSARFATMATIEFPTNTFTLATFRMAYKNLISGFYSATGHFLSRYSETEIENQRIRSRFPYDMQVYETMNIDENLDENHVLVNPTIQVFTEKQRQLAILTPEFATLSDTHRQALGFTNVLNEDIPTPELTIDVETCCSTFSFVRIFAAVLLLAVFWSIVVGLLAAIGLPPIILYQAIRRVLGLQI